MEQVAFHQTLATNQQTTLSADVESPSIMPYASLLNESMSAGSCSVDGTANSRRTHTERQRNRPWACILSKLGYMQSDMTGYMLLMCSRTWRGSYRW